MEQMLPCCRRELIEGVAGSIGEGAPKAQDFLELHAGVQLELIGPGRPRCRTPPSAGSGGKTFVAGCNPNGNLRADIRGPVFGLAYCSGGADQLARGNRRRQAPSRKSYKTPSRSLACHLHLLKK